MFNLIHSDAVIKNLDCQPRDGAFRTPHLPSCAAVEVLAKALQGKTKRDRIEEPSQYLQASETVGAQP